MGKQEASIILEFNFGEIQISFFLITCKWPLTGKCNNVLALLILRLLFRRGGLHDKTQEHLHCRLYPPQIFTISVKTFTWLRLAD